MKFISKEVGVKYDSLSLDTSLNLDLGMDGDDAIDFFEKLQKKFNVNLNKFMNDEYEKYFGFEGINPFKEIKRLFTSSEKFQKFTIQMLIEILQNAEQK